MQAVTEEDDAFGLNSDSMEREIQSPCNEFLMECNPCSQMISLDEEMYAKPVRTIFFFENPKHFIL